MIFLIFSLLLVCVRAEEYRRFPDDFLFGVSTSAYQIEGAWDVDGKSVSIWDHVVHTYPEAVADNSNGDITTDSYNNFKRDVEMLRELGVDVYRMSLSWTRLLPNGFPNTINQAGVDFYNSYIDELLNFNITPIMTLYHWDLPKNLQDLGGFSSPMMADWFEDYVRIAFELFGDRVKHWITFNEPSLICYFGYGTDWLAPRLNATDVGTYYCAKHLVLAHARAYHVYNDEFRSSQGGVIGITFQVTWYSPLSESTEDAFAVELAIQGEVGIYAHPIFSKEGGYPKDFAKRVAERSSQHGYPRSRLPEFTEEERNSALETADFFGINHYSGWKVSASECRINYPESSYFDDVGVGFCMLEEWEKASPFMALAPDSLFHVIAHVSKTYDYPPILITENGWPTPPEVSLDDDQRIKYYRAAWKSVLDALEEGYDVGGYMTWSLMDNFEWMSGYTERYGLYEVDFTHPERTRIPKKSAFVYKELIRSRRLDPEFTPHNMTMWIDDGH